MDAYDHMVIAQDKALRRLNWLMLSFFANLILAFLLAVELSK